MTEDPANVLTAISEKTPKYNHPTNSSQIPDSRNYELTNVCCFKSLNTGLVCCAARYLIYMHTHAYIYIQRNVFLFLFCFWFTIKRGGAGQEVVVPDPRDWGILKTAAPGKPAWGRLGPQKEGALGELETFLGWLPETSKRMGSQTPLVPYTFQFPAPSSFWLTLTMQSRA